MGDPICLLSSIEITCFRLAHDWIGKTSYKIRRVCHDCRISLLFLPLQFFVLVDKLKNKICKNEDKACAKADKDWDEKSQIRVGRGSASESSLSLPVTVATWIGARALLPFGLATGDVYYLR